MARVHRKTVATAINYALRSREVTLVREWTKRHNISQREFARRVGIDPTKISAHLNLTRYKPIYSAKINQYLRNQLLLEKASE